MERQTGARVIGHASLALALAVGAPLSALAGASAATPPATVTDPARGIEACKTTDESVFRDAVEAITIKAIENGLSSVDYRAAVQEEWRRLDLGAIIDREVDRAVAAVTSETSWGALIQSLGDKEKANELTVAVAERVYRSEPVKTAIEALAAGIGRSLGKHIELATEDASRPAILCLEAFLGPRYGATVASVVTGNASREFAVDPAAGGATVTSGQVLEQSTGGITGAAILIMRRQLAKMAGRIGQRIAGSVLTRLVSVVAGGIGLVLIAKDVWDLRNGVMPIIAEEMKSKETKEKVQEELARSISEQIGLHVKEIGRDAAQRVVTVWREFQSQHAKVLELAERFPAYKAFLDRVEPTRVARLGEATALELAQTGEEGLMGRIENGTLEEAVSRLPEPAFDIARQTRSLETALAWNGVAQDLIGEVVALDIFRRAPPQDFTHRSLERLLALEDPTAISRAAQLTRETRDILLSLDPQRAKQATLILSVDELNTLADYLRALPPEPRDAILGAIADNPARLEAVAKPRVRDAILASRDRGAAVRMMLRADADADAILADIRLAVAGDIEPILIIERHPVLAVGAGVAGLLLILLLIRLFRPARAPTTAVHQS